MENKKFRGGWFNDLGGYTLIELLIVMGIIIVLFAAAVDGIIRSQRVFTFNAAFQQVSSMVREARSLAITGRSVIDYTDYDQDGCRNAGNHDTPDCAMLATEDDKVTPAHYGVHFDTGTNTMTLFADMHGTGTEGVYDGTAGFQEYAVNRDMKIAEYTVPEALKLLASGSGTSSSTDTVMYSPIFADTAFYAGNPVNAPVDLTGEFFVFGIRENPPYTREQCLVIHPIAGVPETTDATGKACPL